MQLSEFAQGILNSIDEPDRPTVAKYLSTWDKGVQNKFTEYQEKLKPYTDLGSIEEIQETLQWISLLNEDPIKFHNDLGQMIKDAGLLKVDPNLPPENPPVGKDMPAWAADLPAELYELMTKQQDTINSLTSKLSAIDEEKENNRKLAEFDNYLTSLHNEHGEFDHDYVMTKMAGGLTVEDAIQAFNDLIGKNKIPSNVQTPIPTPPKIITGAAAVVQGKEDLGKLPKKDSRELFVKALIAAAGEQG